MSIIEVDPLEEIPVLDDKPVDPVTQVLIEAKELIKEKGWYHGTANRGICSIVALSVAAQRKGFSRSQYMEAYNRFCHVIDYIYIPKWNDAPERTIEEVYEAFDKAIMNG